MSEDTARAGGGAVARVVLDTRSVCRVEKGESWSEGETENPASQGLLPSTSTTYYSLGR